jgi:hypothetical protein
MKNMINQAVSTDQNKISELEDKIVLLEDEKALLENEKSELLAKLYWYEEKFRLEQHRRYGRSSEQTGSIIRLRFCRQAGSPTSCFLYINMF